MLNLISMNRHKTINKFLENHNLNNDKLIKIKQDAS